MIRVISARSLFLILVIPKKRTIIEDGKPADDREVGEEKSLWVGSSSKMKKIVLGKPAL